MPRVLLTGATGFVGRQILSALQRSGVEVRLVIRSGSETRLAANAPKNFVATPDLFGESSDWWADVCQGVDTVVHAAWNMQPGQYLESPQNLDCLQGTLSFAKGATQANVQRFVGIGTCAEYDVSGGYLSVDTPLRPSNLYGSTKAAAFMALNSWLPSQNVEFAWARLFYLYGEGEDTRRLVPYLRSRLKAGEEVALTSGAQIRDYLDVADVGEQIASLTLGRVTGAVNICSGQAQTVREFAERIADEYGRRDLLRFGARAENPFDPPCVVGVRSEAC